MDQQPLIGVVTVTYNSAGFLAEFINSCVTQDETRFKVYCIDNDSHDSTAAELSTVSDPRWVVTLNPKNVGVAEGNNQGIVQALRDGCEWVILLNNDTTFEPGFLRLLIQACARNDWRVVVPKIHFDTPAGHLWYAGGGFNPRRGHTGFHAGLGERDHGQFNSETTVDYSPTCAMLIHRSVFHEVGVMDETYFVYFDDTDFCWRLRKAGVPIGYTATTCLVHKVGGSTGGTTSPFTAKITARNRLYFLHKHFGAATAFSWTPVFLLYYLVRYGLRWNIECLKASIEGSFSYRGLARKEPTLPPDA